MAEPADGPPVVPLPERVDRRLRLGPFPSAQDAVKFLAYAGVGALLAALVGPLVGLGVTVAGFLFSTVRYEDDGLDRRALAVVRFWIERPPRLAAGAMTPLSGLERRGVAVGPSGGYVAVVRVGGSPMAYLPPAEIARRFDRYRELVRSEPEGLVLRVWLAPMRAAPVVPRSIDAGRTDAPARDGYAQLMQLLCARRSVRKVDLLRRSSRAGAEGLAELETHVTRLVDRLAALDLPARRLAGRALVDATRRLTGGGTEAPTGGRG